MSSAAGKPFPVIYTQSIRFGTWGWAVCCHYQPDFEDGDVRAWADCRLGYSPLQFRTEVEAQRVSDWLAQNGYTTDESMMALSDEETRRIMCEGLAW